MSGTHRRQFVLLRSYSDWSLHVRCSCGWTSEVWLCLSWGLERAAAAVGSQWLRHEQRAIEAWLKRKPAA